MKPGQPQRVTLSDSLESYSLLQPIDFINHP
jgi:hypothetical protein